MSFVEMIGLLSLQTILSSFALLTLDTSTFRQVTTIHSKPNEGNQIYTESFCSTSRAETRRTIIPLTACVFFEFRRTDIVRNVSHTPSSKTVGPSVIGAYVYRLTTTTSFAVFTRI